VKISITGKLPYGLDKNLVFALDTIFRDIEKSVNSLESEVMPRAVPSAVLTSDSLVRTGQAIYRGFTVMATTATADINVYDGTSNSGKLIDVIPTGSTKGTTEERQVGITCETGLYVDFTGSATGSVQINYEPL
jgi:hypothetical protein